MNKVRDLEEQVVIWGYYKPRHTHAWNMLVLAHRAFDDLNDELDGFVCEYCWENFIIRLWLYRLAVNTLTKIDFIATEAIATVAAFDQHFTDGDNALRAIRNMIEHFDEYADGEGRGPATRSGDLDPWREVSPDRFERGRFAIERASAYAAAINLRSVATDLSKKFTDHYKSAQNGDRPQGETAI